MNLLVMTYALTVARTVSERINMSVADVSTTTTLTLMTPNVPCAQVPLSAWFATHRTLLPARNAPLASLSVVMGSALFVLLDVLSVKLQRNVPSSRMMVRPLSLMETKLSLQFVVVAVQNVPLTMLISAPDARKAST